MSEHIWKRVYALDKAMECPWCGETAFMPRRTKIDEDGIDFIVYECDKCPCEGSFSV